jgi:hypothetical protein
MHSLLVLFYYKTFVAKKRHRKYSLLTAGAKMLNRIYLTFSFLAKY